MARKIGLRRVIAALEEVVAENGGPEVTYADVYSRIVGERVDHPACVYRASTWDDHLHAGVGVPACIVGQVLINKFGIEPDDGGAWPIRSVAPVFTPAANRALAAAQAVQDGRSIVVHVPELYTHARQGNPNSTWGEALVWAKRMGRTPTWDGGQA